MWTKEDEKRSTEKALFELLTLKNEYIKILGKERYERSVAELRNRLGLGSSSEDQNSDPQS
jgi:hypothetical protein